jgi:hypothetical protein
MIKYLDRIRNLVRGDATMANNEIVMYSEEQLMARLKFFIGICLALTLTGIVFVVLYSIIFVTQPLNAISPIDQKFFELIIPIATFLTGTLSGIMLAGGNKEAQAEALKAANKGWDRPVTPIQTSSPSPYTPKPNFGRDPYAPSYYGAASVAMGGMAGMATQQVAISSTGKPMPAQEPEPEL